MTILFGFILLTWITFLYVVAPKSTALSGDYPSLKSNPPRVAFATILTERIDVDFPNVETPYLQAARLLSFQLLRNPRTRTRIPGAQFVVLVTPEIPKTHRDVLSREGALVVPVETLPFSEKYKNIPVDLNIWQLVEYDKVLYLDATSVILHPLDDIFKDTTTNVRAIPGGESHLPGSYLMAGWEQRWMDMTQSSGSVSQSDKNENRDTMSTGFFVTRPSSDMFQYYARSLHSMEKSSSDHLAHNFLNYVHRKDGPMPWTSIGSGWSLRGPSQWDIDNGLRSINHGWWRPATDGIVQARIEATMGEWVAYLNH